MYKVYGFDAFFPTKRWDVLGLAGRYSLCFLEALKPPRKASQQNVVLTWNTVKLTTRGLVCAELVQERWELHHLFQPSFTQVNVILPGNNSGLLVFFRPCFTSAIMLCVFCPFPFCSTANCTKKVIFFILDTVCYIHGQVLTGQNWVILLSPHREHK